jgi:hypothetical protein
MEIRSPFLPPKKAPALSLWDRLFAVLPPAVKRRLGFRDRAAEAEQELASVLAMWDTGDREYRVQLQGRATATLSYLPTARLVSVAGETKFDWLRLRALEILERRALGPDQVVVLWASVGRHETYRERLAKMASASLVGNRVPENYPVELLQAAADAGGIGQAEAVEALLERRPPDVDRSLWHYRSGVRSPRLQAHLRALLPTCGFATLARVAPGLEDDKKMGPVFRQALLKSILALPAPELGPAAQEFPEYAEPLVAEIVRRLGHLSSPIGVVAPLKKDRPKRGDADDLRELAERLLAHSRLEEAEALMAEILELELRRTRAGLAPIADKAVGAMLTRYPTGVIGAEAAKVLGLIGTKASVQTLLEAAASLDENIRARALAAISAINERGTKQASR